MKDPTYYQVPVPPDDRPDGRTASPEILRLRSATRALRLHLDGLPVDYNTGGEPDQFLAGISFNFARQRYGCAESLIGAGMGGVVLGAMARSLLVDGLRWRWVAEDPLVRRRVLIGDLVDERLRLRRTVLEEGLTVRHIDRWLLPVPPVADLSGGSPGWIDVSTFPTDDDLLADFLNSTELQTTEDSPSSPMNLLDASSMRGVTLLLAFAGHGNFLGLQSCLAEDGQPGYDLRPQYEALFMHAAAVGTVAVLHGTASAVPELWPSDVDKAMFLGVATTLANDVAEAARPLHRLVAKKPRRFNSARASARERDAPTDGASVIRSYMLPPEPDVLAPTVDAAERFWTISRAMPVRREHFQQRATALHEVLNFGGANSNLEAALATYDKDGSGPIAVFAARMLLEEAARLKWRFSVGPDQFPERATQYFDDFRARTRSTINRLRGDGIAANEAERLFELPSYVVKPPAKPPPKNRKPLPSITSMLRAFGADVSPDRPGWLVLAYSLLSQITHATTLGSLHTIRVEPPETWHINELSPELMALSLDVACLAGGYLIGHSSLVLTDISPEAVTYRDVLRRESSRVHRAAREVHGLG